ncbi:hypothetical protein J6T93_08210 [bacterium]|nr:hypothetical protein [bacterium]
MTKYYSLFLFLLFLAAETTAAGPEQWKKAFSGDGVGVYKSGICDVYYFEKCVVPGPPKLTVIEDDFSGGETSKDGKMREARENVDFYENKVKDLEKRIAEAAEDSEEKDSLESDLKANKLMLQEAQKIINELEQEKEGAKKVVQAEQTKKTHEEPTTNYYEVPSFGRALKRAADIFSEVGNGYDRAPRVFRIYLVTSPKMWNALKSAENNKNFRPARNICFDAQSRSILLFASPAIKDAVPKTLSYVVASFYYDLAMASQKEPGVACDMIKYGLILKASGLREVVEPGKIVALPSIKENELLVPSELMSPANMQDSKRCYIYLRQCVAVTDFLERNADLINYMKNVRGGNSGLRSDFPLLKMRASWAKNYDDFINDMPKRLFFPLTEEAAKNPSAMGEWKKELSEEDRDYRERRENVQKRKDDRAHRRETDPSYYRWKRSR